jgi:hypothetical protein
METSMSRHLRPLVLVLVLALTLVACGDDDSIGGLPGDAGDLPGDVGDLPGDAGDLGDLPGVGDIPGLSDECSAFLSLSSAMASAFTGTFSGFEGDLVSSLPAAAQADGAVVVAALQEFSNALADAGIDLSEGIGTLSQEQLQAFSQLGESIFTDEVNDAFDRIGDVASASCGGDES